MTRVYLVQQDRCGHKLFHIESIKFDREIMKNSQISHTFVEDVGNNYTTADRGGLALWTNEPFHPAITMVIPH